MFDRLVESSKQKQGKRARSLFLATSMIYAVALSAFCIMAILGFSPALAGESSMMTILIPPPPPLGPLEVQPKQLNPRETQVSTYFDSEKISKLPPLAEAPNTKVIHTGNVPGGALDWAGLGSGASIGTDMKEPPPPPPTPTPAPVVKPIATPTPDSVVRLTSVLTQGRAIRRVEPTYPALAKQARIQGMVQVQIGISETGAVSEVTLLSGHPLLRDAALQAARQWMFKPTELNGRPVRAVGLITFNFKLD